MCECGQHYERVLVSGHQGGSGRAGPGCPGADDGARVTCVARAGGGAPGE